MKRFLSLLLVSILGGAISLLSYKYLYEEDQQIITVADPIPQYTPVNFNPNNPNGVDFTEAAKKTVHAVVHVKNIALSQSPFRGRPGIALQGTGSGVIISPDGYIVTNHHVIKNANKIQVTLNNNRSYIAEVIGADPKTDIALIKIDAEGLDYLPFGNSNNVQIGDWVLAVGNPFNLTSTVTAGIVSAKSRDLGMDADISSFIQTDAAINPGNSGGALVNTRGELIGINTAIHSRTGSYVGYSFAVPSNNARKIVEDILEFGDVQRGILGIKGIHAGNVRGNSDVDITQGVFVSSVELGSGADKAGIREADVIVKIDDIQIRKFSDLTGYIGSKRPNDVVEVSVLRDGKIITMDVKLTKYEVFQIKVIGLEVSNASEEELKRKNARNGVKITRGLTPQMQAENLSGTIITEIDGQPVYNIDDVERIIKSKDYYDPISITFITNGGEVKKYVWR